MPRVFPSCCICFSNDEEDWSALNCGHVFHTVCLAQSLRICAKKCPKCRKNASKPQKLFLEVEDDAAADHPQTGDEQIQVFKSKIQELKVELTQEQTKVLELEESNQVLLQQLQIATKSEQHASKRKDEYKDRLAANQRQLDECYRIMAENKHHHEQTVASLNNQVEMLSAQLKDEQNKTEKLEAQKRSKSVAARVAKNPSMDAVNVAGLLLDCNQEDIAIIVQTRNAELLECKSKVKRLENELVQMREKWEHQHTATERRAAQEKEDLVRELEKTKRRLNQYELDLAKLRAAAVTAEATALDADTQHESDLDMPLSMDDMLGTQLPSDVRGGAEETQTQEAAFDDFENEDPSLFIPNLPTTFSLTGVKRAMAAESGPSFFGKTDPNWSTQTSSLRRPAAADGRGGTSRILTQLSGNKQKMAFAQVAGGRKSKKMKPAAATTLHRYGFCSKN